MILIRCRSVAVQSGYHPLPAGPVLHKSENLCCFSNRQIDNALFVASYGENAVDNFHIRKYETINYARDNTVLTILRWWSACRSSLPEAVMSVCNRNRNSSVHHWTLLLLVPALRRLHPFIKTIRIGSSVSEPKLINFPVGLIPVSQDPFLILLNLQSFKEPLLLARRWAAQVRRPVVLKPFLAIRSRPASCAC